MDQHIPEIQITFEESRSLRQRPGPRVKVRANARAMTPKPLRQNVTSKLLAVSRCRVTTPAMLQSRVTTIIRDMAWKRDMAFRE